MTRTFWLSFVREADGEFLGACLVDVTDEDVARIRPELQARFPKATDGAGWIAAASRLAHEAGCNPGGEMLAVEATGHPEADRYPRSVLLDKAALEAIGPLIQVGD